MTALALLLVLYVLGLVVSLAWGPRRYPELCVCMAFPVGVLLASAILLGALYVELPPRIVVGLGAPAFAGLAIRELFQRGGLSRRDWLILGGGTLLFALVFTVLTLRDVSTTTYFSYDLILRVQVLGAGGSVYDGKLYLAFSKLGGLTFAAHGLADLVRLDYLSALQPALYVATCAFSVALIGRASALGHAPRWVSIGAVVTTAIILAQPAMVYAGFAIGSASFVATYGVLAVGLWWLAEREGDARNAALASLCLLALFVLSDWGAVIGVGLFALLVVPSPLAARRLDIPVGAMVAAAFAWLLSAARNFSDETRPYFFTGSEARSVLVAVLAVYLLWLALRGRTLDSRIRQSPPWVLPVAVVGAFVAVAAWLGAHHGLASVWDALEAGGWRLTIVVLAGASLVGLVARPMPGERIFLLTSVLYAGTLLWVGTAVEDYAFDPPLGAVQQISSHLVLFLLLQVALKVVSLCSESEPRARAPTPARDGRS